MTTNITDPTQFADITDQTTGINIVFNETIEPGMIPNHITCINFGYMYNQVIEPGVLPDGLKRLNFMGIFNQPILPNTLPSSLSILYFCRFYNQPIGPGVLPENICMLAFSDCFNQPIETNVIPPNTKTLIIGASFDQRIEPGVLPDTLGSMCFYNNPRKLLYEDMIPRDLSVIKYMKCLNSNQLEDVPLSTSIYFIYDERHTHIDLRGIRHQIFVGLGRLDRPIIKGLMPGVHYVCTRVEKCREYLVIVGDDYIHLKSKSARK